MHRRRAEWRGAAACARRAVMGGGLLPRRYSARRSALPSHQRTPTAHRYLAAEEEKKSFGHEHQAATAMRAYESGTKQSQQRCGARCVVCDGGEPGERAEARTGTAKTQSTRIPDPEAPPSASCTDPLGCTARRFLYSARKAPTFGCSC